MNESTSREAATWVRLEREAERSCQWRCLACDVTAEPGIHACVSTRDEAQGLRFYRAPRRLSYSERIVVRLAVGVGPRGYFDVTILPNGFGVQQVDPEGGAYLPLAGAAPIAVPL